MISIPTVIIVGNALLIFITSVLAIKLLRASSKYNFAIGDIDKQTIYKRRALKMILLLVMVALTAAVFNIILAPL